MVAGISESVRRARVLGGGASGEGRVGPRGHARSVHGEAFAGGGLIRRSARVASTPTLVLALTIVRGAAPVITVVAVRTVLLGGAAAVDRRVGPGREAGRSALLAVPGGVVAAALVAAVPAEGEQEDEEDDDYRDARDDTCVEITNLRRVRAESPRRPPRHRRDACSMAWRCRFLAARRSQDGRVIAEK